MMYDLLQFDFRFVLSCFVVLLLFGSGSGSGLVWLRLVWGWFGFLCVWCFSSVALRCVLLYSVRCFSAAVTFGCTDSVNLLYAS